MSMPLSSMHMDKCGVYWVFFDFRWEWCIESYCSSRYSNKFAHQPWSLHSGHGRGGCDSRQEIPKSIDVALGPLRARPLSLSTGQESVCAQVGMCICLGWEKNTQMNLQQKAWVNRTRIPHFNQNCPRAAWKQFRISWVLGEKYAGQVSRGGLQNVCALDSFKRLPVSNSMLWPRWSGKKKKLFNPYFF